MRDCLDELSRSRDDPANLNWQLIRQHLYLHELESALAEMERRLTGAAVH